MDEKFNNKVKNVYQVYGIVCDNSMYGADCRGQTICICKCFLYDKNFGKYYGNTKMNKNQLHHDFKCKKCNIIICGCCYNECPITMCKGDESTREYLPHFRPKSK